MSFVAHREPATEPGLPTLLVLHGTGGDETSLVPIAKSVAPGATILSLRGRIDERGMPRFFRRFAEGIFDFDNIRDEADALAEFLAQEPGEKVALGYSNGANMAWSTVLRHPEVLAGGILLRPMQTLDEEADLTGKKFFVSSGRFDPIVPVENVEGLVQQMEALGAEVQFNLLPEGHELNRAELETAKEWFSSFRR